MRRYLPTPRLSRRPAKGQAMVEFALTLGLLLLLVITTLNMLPAISARGTVMNAAAAAVETTSRFLAPSAGGSVAGNRTNACMLAQRSARAVLQRSVPAAGLGDRLSVSGVSNRCTNSTSTSNPAIYFHSSSPSNQLTRGSEFTLCTRYYWRPTGGLFWLTSNGPFGLRDWTHRLFSYEYCGTGHVYAHRTR